MAREKINIDQAKIRWFIDLGWFQQNTRSISALVESRLCAKCRKQLAAEEKEPTDIELLSLVKDCCSQAPEFFTGQLPILESAFRLFLANGNQPLTMEELGKQLSDKRGGDTSRTWEGILSRLLQSDQFYGLKPASD